MTSTPVSDATLFFSNISTKNQNVTGLGSADVSFSEVMNKTSGQNAGVMTGQNQPMNVSDKTKEVSTKTDETKEDGTIREEATQNTDETEKVTDVNETEKPDEMAETVEEELEEAAEELISEIAKELGVTVEDVEKVLEQLGIAAVGLFDKENLTQVVVALNGAEDVTQIMMDEELFTQVNNLLGKMESLLNEVSETVDITVEELMEYVSSEEFEAGFKLQTSDEKVIEAEVVVEEETADKEIPADKTITKENVETDENTVKVEVVETSESTSKETHQNMSQNDTEPNQQFLTNVNADNNLQNVALNQDNGMNPYVSFEAREIMQQILDYIKVSVKPDMTSLQMQLNPEELGTLQIEVTNKNGMLTAQFTTQDESVKTIIESQLIQLKENLNEQGLKVQAVEVTVASQQFDRNLDKNGNEGTTQEENKNASKKQIRRINLNELDTEDDLAEADDAIRIAADMMARNGNTIDFMA